MILHSMKNYLHVVVRRRLFGARRGATLIFLIDRTINRIRSPRFII